MSGISYQLRKTADRAGFEADKLMRANRVRAESMRMKKQVEARIFELGEKTLALAEGGQELPSTLQAIVEDIRASHTELLKKQAEMDAIRAEAWVAPPEPPEHPQPSPAPQRSPVALNSGTAQNEPQEFCPSCKSPIRSAAAFCPSCGLKLKH